MYAGNEAFVKSLTLTLTRGEICPGEDFAIILTISLLYDASHAFKYNSKQGTCSTKRLWRELVFKSLLPITDSRGSVVHVACCLTPIAHSLMPVAYCLSHIAHCLLPVA